MLLDLDKEALGIDNSYFELDLDEAFSKDELSDP
jgi:hypothetical protein